MSCLFLNSGLEIPINFCVSRDLQTDYLIYYRNNAPYNAHRVYHTFSPKSLLRGYISEGMGKFVDIAAHLQALDICYNARRDQSILVAPYTD